MSVLVDRIGLLVTNADAGELTDAYVVIEDSRVTRDRYRAWPRRPTTASTPTAGASSLASSTATPTSSSPATAPPSSPPAWPARRTRPAGSRSPSTPRGPPATTSCAGWHSAGSPRPTGPGSRPSRSSPVTAPPLPTRRRLLGVASQLTAETTFLGAHVVPEEYAGRTDDYVDLVCGEMLAACAPQSRWIDAFCERGAFDAAPMPRGARPRVEKLASGCASTPTNWGTARASGSPWRWAARRPTTARSSMTPMWKHWPAATLWRRSFLPPTSRPASRIRTPAA